MYDEEVEETVPKADTLEKQPEQVSVTHNILNNVLCYY